MKNINILPGLLFLLLTFSGITSLLAQVQEPCTGDGDCGIYGLVTASFNMASETVDQGATRTYTLTVTGTIGGVISSNDYEATYDQNGTLTSNGIEVTWNFGPATFDWTVS